MIDLKKLGTAAALIMAAVGSAQAVNVASGQLWHVPEAISQNAILANLPGTPAAVTFDVNSPFNFNVNGTVATFLGSSGAFNIVENIPGTLASLTDNGVQGMLIYFTGLVTVTTGQTFTVTHDDGLTLVIGGLNLGFSPGPTGPVTTTNTYTGPSGTLPFQLLYGECCGGAAVLQVNLPFVSTPAVPEPGTYALMLAGLGIVGFMARRRKV